MSTKGITIDDLRERIKGIDIAVQRLRIERELVEDLIRHAQFKDAQSIGKESANGNVKPESSSRVAHGKGCTPAIKELVAAEPGLTGTQIVDRLETTIDTSSGNRRRLIQNTLNSLHKRGHLRRTAAGRFHPPSESE